MTELIHPEAILKPYRLFSYWDHIRTGLLTTIHKFNNDELTFKPFADSWSVGEIMLHIASAEEGWFRYVIMRELDSWPEPYTLADYPTIHLIEALLQEIHAHTKAYLLHADVADLEHVAILPYGETLTHGEIIWHVLEHEIHHRGELSLILGFLGREGLAV